MTFSAISADWRKACCIHKQIQRKGRGPDINLNVHIVRYMSGTTKRKIMNN
ncbi:hypothetical protein EUBSIR_02602 [[Eubacterium] siraeum DSM 15702]|uniref:Uncharacterized protein n=1 Tax=[Eubacterium] siraeum DSM 15702 TaxID=428128 RepID=B0MRW9_9FIRM|nr:hypothetical protein EUBSIR_02602 [[Eubacterium] siraeum DSM 15702]